MPEITYIVIIDTSPSKNILWISGSVTDVLGYEAEELVGISAYDNFHPTESNALGLVFENTLMTDPTCYVTRLRLRHKNDTYVEVEILGSVCYDMIIGIVTPLNRRSLSYKARHATAEQVYDIHPDGKMYRRIWNAEQRKLIELMSRRYLSGEALNPIEPLEPRVCMMIDRFTIDSKIQFTSPLTQFLLGISVDEVINRSFFSLVKHPDQSRVQQEISFVKSTNSVTYIKFAFCSQVFNHLVVEGVVSCASDGLVVVLRPYIPHEYQSMNTHVLGEENVESETELDYEDEEKSQAVRTVAEMGIYVWPDQLKRAV
ncbi:hypothetical protein K493DRAFT_305442 [Basidiobolus meristosporus CBS 931.73]|uniref:PAS domain-containing protein n=1 Tax=Basidiobolus meristosporus CBS 931.73 TaxID=1314790 RepID=A0A1Y1XVN1_9FUNG|nr:hypothetical protein K493DRAFT_305442 [Basidiobolus meristosporus CBS 931.73]|eukprot:ORX89809.1 hypothetical protein K493DRAFT_305442 [Basidiobolus meristosporus CBS 931.73]